MCWRGFLRNKLDDDSANPTYIHTVAGIGYTFQRREGMTPSTAAAVTASSATMR